MSAPSRPLAGPNGSAGRSVSYRGPVPPSTLLPSTVTLRAGVRLVAAAVSGLLTARPSPSTTSGGSPRSGSALLSAPSSAPAGGWRCCSGWSTAWPSSSRRCPGRASTSATCRGSPWPPSRPSTSRRCARSPPPSSAPCSPSRLRPLAYAAVPLAWVLQEWARGTTPFGGFPWARLAFSQADSPLAHVRPVRRRARAHVRRGRPRRPAAPGRPRADPPGGAPAPRPRPRHTGAWRWLAVLAVGAARAAPLATTLPTDGRTVSVLFVQGNVPKPGLDFNAQRRAVLDNHVQGTLGAVATGHPTPRAWSSGRRTPPTSTRSATPTPRPTIQARRRDRQGADPRRGGARRAGPATSPTSACSTCPGGAEPAALRQAAPGAVRRVHPVPRLLPELQRQGRPGPRDFTAGDQAGGFEVPVTGERPYWSCPTICFEVAYDELMRDSTRPARATTPAARRADQQRDVRLHRRVRAAVRDQPDPRDRARPLGRARLDGRASAASSPPTERTSTRPTLFTASGPVRVAGGPHRGHPVRPARAAAGVCRGRWRSWRSWHSALWLRRRTARVERAADGPSAPAHARRDRVVV